MTKLILSKKQKERVLDIKRMNELFKKKDIIEKEIKKIDEKVWKHIEGNTFTYKAPFRIWLLGKGSFDFELACVYDFKEYDREIGVCYSSIYWFSYEEREECFNTDSGEWYLKSIEKHYKQISLKKARKLYDEFVKTHKLSSEDKIKMENFLNGN